MMRALRRLIEPDALDPASHQAPRFSHWLPYLAADAADCVYENENSHGFVMECMPQVGADMEMARILTSLLTLGWPPDTGIQVHMYASPNIRSMLAGWASIRISETSDSQRASGIYRTLARRRVEYILSGARASLFNSAPYLIRDFRVFVSVTLPGRMSEENRARLIELRRGAKAVLAGAHLPAWDMSPSALITWLAEMLNQEDYDRDIAYDPGRLIRNQILNYGTILDVKPDHILINGRTEVRMMSVKNYPEEFPLWGMSGLVGDFYQANLQYPCPFLFTLGVHLPDLESAKAGAQMKAARATHDAETPMAKFLPDFALKKRDWDIVMHALAEGHSMVQLYHQLVLFAPRGRGVQAEQAARAVLRGKSWESCLDRFMQTQGLLAALPMTLPKEMWSDIKRMERYSTKTTGNAMHMAPLLADWKGTGSPTLMLYSRRGQVIHFDLFDNKEGNYNVAVAAASGSGKSFLLNEITLSYLGIGGRVWIIDVGRSYEKLCRLLEGEFIEFAPDSNICINPFTHVRDLDEEMALLKPLLARMAAASRETDDLENAMLEEAIRRSWESKGNTMTVTDVADWLAAQDDDRARDLARMLLPYTARGMYARYFEGRNTLDFDNRFVVLELEELKAKKDLQAVVLMIVMYQIQQAMYLGERGQRKICIIDEAWDLMSGAGEFIETGYRRVRKYGGAFITATQSIGDYYKYDASLAAFENSDWLLLLRQKKESVEQLTESGRLKVDDSMKRMLMSLKTSHGEFSEVFIYSAAGMGIGRLVVDPYSTLLYSSKAEDFARIKELTREGMDITSAIEQVLRERA
jgi:conjugal transfer ATP-binding protein TraC